MRIVTIVALAAVWTAPALAQGANAPGADARLPGSPAAGTVGSTIGGDLPDRAGSTAAVGKTKPAGAPLGDKLGTRSELEEKSREIDRKIGTGICTGCR